MSDTTTVARLLLATGVVPAAAARHLQGMCGDEVPVVLDLADTTEAVERIRSMAAPTAVGALSKLDAAALLALAHVETRKTVHRAMIDANLKSVDAAVQGEVLVELAARGYLPEDRYRHFDYPDVARQVHQRPDAVQLLWNSKVLHAFLDRLLEHDPTGRALADWFDDHVADLPDDTPRPLAAHVAKGVCRRLEDAEHPEVSGDAAVRLVTAHTDPAEAAVRIAAARALVHQPGQSTDVRLAIVAGSRPMAARWLHGDTANDPQPGEIALGFAQAGGWHNGGHPLIAELSSLVGRFNRQHRPAWLPEAMGLVPADKALASTHKGAAAQRIRDRVGDSPSAWQTVCSLVDGFTGSLDELCDAASALAEPASTT